MEKVLRLESEMGRDSAGTKLPYVGPRTFQQFLECFCVVFRRKHSEAEMEKNNLRCVMYLCNVGPVECSIKQGNRPRGRREGGRKGKRKEGKEVGREGGRERGRKGRRKGQRKELREVGREGREERERRRKGKEDKPFYHG